MAIKPTLLRLSVMTDIMRYSKLLKQVLIILMLLCSTLMSAQEYIVYRVQAGDSFYSIAKKHGVTAKQIIEYNNLSSAQIRIGDRIKIPVNGNVVMENVAEPQNEENSIDVKDNAEYNSAPQIIPVVENNRITSDVDINIPTSSKSQDNTFALIIANEHYKRESDVEYAINDGTVFRKYCLETIGIPQSNVHYIEDATLNDIRAELNWITKVTEAYEGEAKVIFYYAGHGIPDEKTQESYILPVDAYGSDITTAYSLCTLYSTLATHQTTSTIVFLDACFSGAQRSGEMLTSARGVAIKSKPHSPKGNMVVFCASTGDETAYPYTDQGHGMFTYFLLKKLQDSKGKASLGELSEYIRTNVSRKSIVENSKSQTPTVLISTDIIYNWSDLNL